MGPPDTLRRRYFFLLCVVAFVLLHYCCGFAPLTRHERPGAQKLGCVERLLSTHRQAYRNTQPGSQQTKPPQRAGRRVTQDRPRVMKSTQGEMERERERGGRKKKERRRLGCRSSYRCFYQGSAVDFFFLVVAHAVNAVVGSVDIFRVRRLFKGRGLAKRVQGGGDKGWR